MHYPIYSHQVLCKTGLEFQTCAYKIKNTALNIHVYMPCIFKDLESRMLGSWFKKIVCLSTSIYMYMHSQQNCEHANLRQKDSFERDGTWIKIKDANPQ